MIDAHSKISDPLFFNFRIGLERVVHKGAMIQEDGYKNTASSRERNLPPFVVHFGFSTNSAVTVDITARPNVEPDHDNAPPTQEPISKPKSIPQHARNRSFGRPVPDMDVPVIHIRQQIPPVECILTKPTSRQLEFVLPEGWSAQLIR